ncbi:DNA translocase FtsK [Patescibacteria group bacterium]|nr:MAG: DNA translocase FtsK [Patescibacteria group bacterium]
MGTKKNKADSGSSINIFKSLKDETLQGIFAIIFFVIAILCMLAAFEKAGFVGNYAYRILSKLFGLGYYLFPALFTMLGISFFESLERKFDLLRVVGSILFFISGLGLIDLASTGKGGSVGYYISSPLVSLFEKPASVIFLIALLAISILITLDTRIKLEYLFFWRKWFSRKNDDKKSRVKNTGDDDDEEKEFEPVTEAKIILPKEEPVTAQKKEDKKPTRAKELLSLGKEESDFSIGSRLSYANTVFTPPPLSLLERDKGKPEVGDIKANANIIKRTLMNFGIDVEMDEISIGPSVTRYALKPAEGVKLSKIVGLNNDLALALAAHPIRIEAPIPGKSLVGIEIPNSTKTTVGLGTLLAGEEYQQSEKPLLISLGKGISGKSHFANLAKMPHLLIAGATGSGKSVTIHSIITSLLFRNSPDNLKFIMIDPKRVELTLYNKIPHLLTPVITDAKKAILALKWAAKEMDRRYDILESHSVRDVESYHKNVLTPALKKLADNPPKTPPAPGEIPETMPYIVVVIDELADIMQTYPRELESAIVRLAQMSRAIGIHLMLSTQRPSVNVITGLIKANVPSRVALQVSSQIDSRTILDTGGAEKLLGAGDMLYLGGEMSKPQRIQSSYISEVELKRVVKYLADTYQDAIPHEINLATAENDKNVLFDSSFGDESLEEDDDMYEDAKQAVLEAGKASTSYIQRKLRVGYSRAARLIDMLEERGVIGPGDGAKPREVLQGGTDSSSPVHPPESEAVAPEDTFSK